VNVFVGNDSVIVELDSSMLNVIIGAIGTVIDDHCDDPDAVAYTDVLHEVETMLVNVRARAGVHHLEGVL